MVRPVGQRRVSHGVRTLISNNMVAPGGGLVQISKELIRQSNYKLVRDRLARSGVDLVMCGSGATWSKRGRPVDPIGHFINMVMPWFRPGPFRAAQAIVAKRLGVSHQAVNDFAQVWDDGAYRTDGRGFNCES